MKIILNLALLCLVYIYMIKPFFQGFMGGNEPPTAPNNAAQKDAEYSDYEEVK
jgi:hypothetical protein